MQSSKMMLVLISALVSCSNRGAEPATPIQTQRSGQTLTNTDPKYIDISPSLSSSALKLAYVSGSAGSLRVFTMTRGAAAAAFDSRKQLSTNTGLTSEEYVMLSPDGNYVLVEGATTDGHALVLCKFDGSTCTSITTTLKPGGAHLYAFSPDSTLFFYLNGTKTSGGSVTVATVTAPTTGAVAGTADHWLTAFWMPVASGYQIIASENAATTNIGKINLVSLTFASQATASSATAATLVSAIASTARIDRGPLTTTGAAARFTVTVPLAPSAAKMVSEIGNVDAASKFTFPIQNELHTYSAAGADEQPDPKQQLQLTGFTTQQTYVGADNDTLFSLQTIVGRCNGEDFLYGDTFVITSQSSKTSFPILLKRTDDRTQIPVIITAMADASKKLPDFCERSINGTNARSELTARYFVVNPGATASAYTIAWVANSSADPSSTTTDPEIYILDMVNGTQTIKAAFLNVLP